MAASPVVEPRMAFFAVCNYGDLAIIAESAARAYVMNLKAVLLAAFLALPAISLKDLSTAT
jgi:hypothetical protein